jgi:hypothetical protein
LLDASRHIELRCYDFAAADRFDAHPAVVMSAGVENVSGCLVPDAHQRIIRRHLGIIAVRSAFRETVKQRA